MKYILIISNSDISITSVTHTDFKLVAESWQRSTSLTAVSTERTTTPSTVVLHTHRQYHHKQQLIIESVSIVSSMV